ncbi:MAG: threonine synthase [Bacillota bacterium]
MDYKSTRGGDARSAGSAILKGIANDGGLYVPTSFPIFTEQDFSVMMDMEYYERAAHILAKYLTDYSKEELLDYCKKAYDRFDGEPAPVVAIDEGTYILELWHGPTLAFKDIALTLLPHLMTAARRKEEKKNKTLILVATSGDTGKAALEGFSDVEGTEIICFYPSEGVSDMQKLQMQTTVGKNVHVVAIDGNFDDAQSAVKTVFADEEAVAKLEDMGYTMSSANSINWGRLAPQIVYYVSAYLDMVSAEEINQGDAVNYVVPTGNFGNILAGYYAKMMGVPINKLIVASNKNNILTDFFTEGKYDVNRAFHKTMSPSMDILVSSNLERLLYELYDHDASKIASIMGELKKFGIYDVSTCDLEEKLPEFVAYWSDEKSTEESIDNFFEQHGYLLDTHTAVAVSSYYDYMADTGDMTPSIVVSTASPYKFSKDVLKALSQNAEDNAFKAVNKLSSYTDTDVPTQIAELANLPILHDIVIPKEAIKDTIFTLLSGKSE